MSAQPAPIGRASRTTDQILQFHTDHRAALLDFQNGDECFVWGLDRRTGELWHLVDETAHEFRKFVNEQVVCPVPGCGEKLTTAHRTKKRDGLQHYAGKGGHSKESVFHSQGCALVEDWLRRAYPRSKTKREEYTNEEGERRADVLLRGPSGHRVAFEIQYSPLTPDAWQRRHDSYQRQDIVDVWLFGHTSTHLKIAQDGQVALNPTHEAVLTSGSVLLFLNPEQTVVGVTVGTARRLNEVTENLEDTHIAVFDDLTHPRLELVPLSECKPSTRYGLSSELIDFVYESTQKLRQRNREAAARIETNRAIKRQKEVERQRFWELRRRPQQERIRELMGEVDRWSRSGAQTAVKSYFGEYMRERIDFNTNISALPGSLVRWQCVVYFDLIAGQSRPFGTRDAFNAIIRRRVNMGHPDAFKIIVRYLYRLEQDGYLQKQPGFGWYPSFVPTVSGAWW